MYMQSIGRCFVDVYSNHQIGYGLGCEECSQFTSTCLQGNCSGPFCVFCLTATYVLLIQHMKPQWCLQSHHTKVDLTSASHLYEVKSLKHSHI